MPGRIIVLNETSSSGKSTLARSLRLSLDPGFCYYASDQLAQGGFWPLDPATRLADRQKFFDGFNRSIPAFADAGMDLLVEHIVEKQSWADDLESLLKGFNAFWVGVHASTKELERREKRRGDRTIGEARFHLATHNICRYQLEIDSTAPLSENVTRITEAWRRREA